MIEAGKLYKKLALRSTDLEFAYSLEKTSFWLNFKLTISRNNFREAK